MSSLRSSWARSGERNLAARGRRAVEPEADAIDAGREDEGVEGGCDSSDDFRVPASPLSRRRIGELSIDIVRSPSEGVRGYVAGSGQGSPLRSRPRS